MDWKEIALRFDHFPDAAELVASGRARRDADVVVYSCAGAGAARDAAAEIIAAGLAYGLLLGEVEEGLAARFGEFAADVSYVGGRVEAAIDPFDAADAG
ncbi:hypothetical protein [Azospirillum thermophilum]|uniref:Uncharacterized protein n=1 Tax=Azospirillum thermophilum TaxID=2202148 RepID=A0A2S2CKI9_9PROT|nr:hypothetical protein [Azospirillum thermophilum]AWK85011.1 hypothetical protein DEW08_01390 [Azospirillum thermophilum]